MGAMMSMSTFNPKRKQHGFTLVEALAALMLVAIILPFVIRAIGVSARNAAYSDREATAVMLAQSQLDEILITDAWQFGDTEGVFEDHYGKDAKRYTWDLAVEDWQSTDFNELTLSVRWLRGGDEQSVQLVTVVYAGS